MVWSTRIFRWLFRLEYSHQSLIIIQPKPNHQRIRTDSSVVRYNMIRVNLDTWLRVVGISSSRFKFKTFDLLYRFFIFPIYSTMFHKANRSDARNWFFQKMEYPWLKLYSITLLLIWGIEWSQNHWCSKITTQMMHAQVEINPKYQEVKICLKKEN